MFLLLSYIAQCTATWEEVYGKVTSMQTQGTGKLTTWYQMVSLGE